MMIEIVTTHYYIWQDKKEYIVTTKRNKNRMELFRGTLKDCEQFIAVHPYGINSNGINKY